MRDKKIYLLYPNCGYCVYYMIQYKVISKKYKKEAVFLGKVLEYSLIFSSMEFLYFVGMFARTALRNSQHFATDGMLALSSGE